MDYFPTASVSAIFTAFISKVTGSLYAPIIALLLVIGGLIALGFVVRLVKRHIGRKI